MTNRFYSSTAQPTTLTAACTDVAATIQVAATTGFPAAPYILAVDYGANQQGTCVGHWRRGHDVDGDTWL